MKQYKVNILADDWRNSIKTMSAKNDNSAIRKTAQYLKAHNIPTAILLDSDFYQIARVFADGTVKPAL